MMRFDKTPAKSIIYVFTATVILPNGEERVYSYEGESYEQCLIKMRQYSQQIEYLYELVERGPEVTEF